MIEREIVGPVALCDATGGLDRAAVGWSRRPLHRANLAGRFPRKKRWDYWCVTDEKIFVALFVADIDYLGVAVVTVTDLASGRRIERVAAVPLGIGCRLPDTVGGAPIRFDRMGLAIAIEPGVGETEIRVRGRGIEAELTVAAPRDSLNVVVPWSDRAFHFTSKQVGLRARGRVAWNGESMAIEEGFGCLDYGRGIWPWESAWNWGAAAGVRGGRTIAFNLGGRWTDGTGATENGLFVDGELTKIGGAVAFERRGEGWRIRSEEVDLAFRPVHARRVGWARGPVHARLDWSAGRFSGRILDCAIEELFGWAEELSARW